MNQRKQLILRLHAAAIATLACAIVAGTASHPELIGTGPPASGPSLPEVTRGTLTASGPGADAVFGTADDAVALPGEDGLASSVTLAAPKGERVVAEGGTGVHDIPATALEAYRRAADILAEVKPTCELPWTLLAGIGRVESDHGRYGGATLGANGLSTPLIIGVALNGVGPVAAIADTDGGRFDQDTVWDRAVGPMQFIPSTWAVAGVDGDGDGVRSPNDIHDAALAAAVYLCAGGDHLREPANMRSALLRYNNSDSYASLVMAYEEAYRTGDYAVSTPASEVQSATAPVPALQPEVDPATKEEVAKTVAAVAAKNGGRTEGISLGMTDDSDELVLAASTTGAAPLRLVTTSVEGPVGAPTPAATGTGTPSVTATPTATSTGSATPTTATSASAKPATSASPSASTGTATSPTQTQPTATAQQTAGTSPTTTGTASSSPEPTQSAVDPTPTGSQTAPTPADPDPAPQQAPDPAPQPEPAPEPEPAPPAEPEPAPGPEQPADAPADSTGEPTGGEEPSPGAGDATATEGPGSTDPSPTP